MNKLLSQGVREVLIKEAVMLILTYTMSCFKLLKSFCTKVEQMMASFWWGQKHEELKIH